MGTAARKKMCCVVLGEQMQIPWLTKGLESPIWPIIAFFFQTVNGAIEDPSTVTSLSAATVASPAKPEEAEPQQQEQQQQAQEEKPPPVAPPVADVVQVSVPEPSSEIEVQTTHVSCWLFSPRALANRATYLSHTVVIVTVVMVMVIVIMDNTRPSALPPAKMMSARPLGTKVFHCVQHLHTCACSLGSLLSSVCPLIPWGIRDSGVALLWSQALGICVHSFPFFCRRLLKKQKKMWRKIPRKEQRQPRRVNLFTTKMQSTGVRNAFFPVHFFELFQTAASLAENTERCRIIVKHCQLLSVIVYKKQWCVCACVHERDSWNFHFRCYIWFTGILRCLFQTRKKGFESFCSNLCFQHFERRPTAEVVLSHFQSRPESFVHSCVASLGKVHVYWIRFRQELDNHPVKAWVQSIRMSIHHVCVNVAIDKEVLAGHIKRCLPGSRGVMKVSLSHAIYGLNLLDIARL